MAGPMELAYEERGSGPVAVFVHGFPLDRTMWIGQLAGLAKIRTAVSVDVRGAGLSVDENPGNYSVDLLADDLAKTLDAIGAEAIDLVGHSMGGYVSMAFWRRHRDRVRSLVFVGTKPEADTDEGKKGREATAANIRENGTAAFWQAAGPKYFGPSPADDIVAKVQKMFENTPDEVAAADLLAMRDRPDSTEDLAKIDVPVLWIHGADDALIPIDLARTAAQKTPGARFIEIPGGHMAPMESPTEANAALTEFFTSL